MTAAYTTGQVTLTNGSTVVTGVLTAWDTALIAGGVIYPEALGNPLPIQSVDGDLAITAATKWQGATGTYHYALVRDTAYLQQVSKNSTTLAGLIAELEAGTVFKYDVSGDLAGRATYDERPAGFSYLVSIGVTEPQLYVKGSATSGDWDGPFDYGKGDMGPPTSLSFGPTVTETPSTPASVVVTGTGPYNLVFHIPRGADGDIEPLGVWTLGNNYSVKQLVTHAGSAYICTVNHTASAANEPGVGASWATDWDLYVAKGDKGDIGPVGAMDPLVYDPLNIDGDAFAYENLHGKNNLSGLRNRVLNSNFRFWQELGSSVANPTNLQYFADQWRVSFDGTGATRTLSRQSHTLGQTDVPGNPKYFLRFAQTVAGSGGTINEINQPIENVSLDAGRDVTLVLYARASSALIAPTIYLQQNFGAGGSPSAAVTTALASNVAIGTGFARYAYKVTLPSVAGKTLGTNGNDYLQLSIRLPPNAVQTFDLSRVSLVPGDATKETDPCEHYDEGFDLFRLRRYFEKSYDVDQPVGQATASPATVFWPGTAVYRKATAAEGDTHFNEALKVTKRVTPTVTWYNPGSGIANRLFDVAQGIAATVTGTSASCPTSPSKVGSPTHAAFGAQGDTVIGHWSANARL